MKKKPDINKALRTLSPYANLKLADLIKDKKTLYWFRDQIIKNDSHVTELAVQFVCMDTEGQSHNRVRASMCLKLASVTLRQSQREELTQCILHRLLTGKFSEQFKDQLKFIIRTNPQWVRAEVKKGLLSEKEHVRRYCAWLDHALSHKK